MAFELANLYNLAREAAGDFMGVFRRNKTQDCYIFQLPSELIVEIARRLALWDQWTLSQSSSVLRNILHEPLTSDELDWPGNPRGCDIQSGVFEPTTYCLFEYRLDHRHMPSIFKNVRIGGYHGKYKKRLTLLINRYWQRFTGPFPPHPT
ncbi:hypothetical protein NLG97_g2042 [Lecanicillium saksenae]|uniref:Uncharacterized protein n=1 Tax=Lecanicillium saksenae TaxID=468837 RepID=A0ACC1R3F9_9HYPO|nr:hypothetical protein NLG97_g2042 [Lecanicillium saksenae]